jgi:hypothetical protein
VAEDRFSSAEEALAVLLGKKVLTPSMPQQNGQVADSPIILMSNGKQLKVVIPPVGLRSAHSRLFALFPLAWNSILLLMIWAITASGILTVLKSVELRFFFLATWPGWLLLGISGVIGLWMLGTFLLSAASRIRLEIDQQNFRLQRCLLGWCYKKIQGRTEITQIELKRIGLSMNKAPITVCTLRSRVRKHRFGSFLTEPEKAWLVAEVKDFLEKQQPVETQETPASEA